MKWTAQYSNGEVKTPSPVIYNMAAEILFEAIEDWLWPKPKMIGTPQENALWTGNY